MDKYTELCSESFFLNTIITFIITLIINITFKFLIINNSPLSYYEELNNNPDIVDNN